jgi:hypothetical protein
MSRTIRRKGAKWQKHNRFWDRTELTVNDGQLHYWSAKYGWQIVWKKQDRSLTPEQAIARDHARFHGDCHSGTWSPPAEFRRNRNRAFRSQCNQMLKNAIATGTEDELVMFDRKSDVAWLWW